MKQIPQKLLNTGKNIGKWFVKLTNDPIGALKELPKEYLKLYWNVIKEVINNFDDMTTIKVELLNEFGDLGGPKFKIAGILLKKLNDLRVPVTDKLKEVIYKFVDEQLSNKPHTPVAHSIPVTEPIQLHSSPVRQTLPYIQIDDDPEAGIYFSHQKNFSTQNTQKR